MNQKEQFAKNMDSIVLGGGCFWCLDAIYKRLKGVNMVEAGYAGGSVDNPKYMYVYKEKTGHAEVVRVHFDPQIISLRQLIDIFWAIHDPTTLNRQGADKGTSYRSIILYSSEEQRKIIEDSKNKTGAPLWEGKSDGSIVTEIKVLEKFYIAEPEHQDYDRRYNYSGYCAVVISPKVAKFKKQFSHLLKDE